MQNLKKIILITIIASMLGCVSNENKKQSDHLKTKKIVVDIDSSQNNKNENFIENPYLSKNIKEYSCDDCFKLIEKIINENSFNKYFINKINSPYVIYIDEATKQKITIQLLLKDSEDNVPLGWLELDLEQDKLYDISDDSDNYKEFAVDNNLINLFKKECLKCCLD